MTFIHDSLIDLSLNFDFRVIHNVIVTTACATEQNDNELVAVVFDVLNNSTILSSNVIVTTACATEQNDNELVAVVFDVLNNSTILSSNEVVDYFSNHHLHPTTQLCCKNVQYYYVNVTTGKTALCSNVNLHFVNRDKFTNLNSFEQKADYLLNPGISSGDFVDIVLLLLKQHTSDPKLFWTLYDALNKAPIDKREKFVKLLNTYFPHYLEIHALLVILYTQSTDYAYQNTDKALAHLKQIEQLWPKAAIIGILNAIICLQLGKPDDAKVLLKESLNEYCEHYLPNFFLGRVYYQLNQPSNAEKHFRNALTHLPHFIPAKKELAAALIQQQKYIEAELLLESIIDEFPEDSTVIHLLMVSARLQDNFDRLAQLAERMTEVIECDAAYYKDLRELYLMLGWNEKAEAIKSKPEAFDPDSFLI